MRLQWKICIVIDIKLVEIFLVHFALQKHYINASEARTFIAHNSISTEFIWYSEFMSHANKMRFYFHALSIYQALQLLKMMK